MTASVQFGGHHPSKTVHRLGLGTQDAGAATVRVRQRRLGLHQRQHRDPLQDQRATHIALERSPTIPASQKVRSEIEKSEFAVGIDRVQACHIAHQPIVHSQPFHDAVPLAERLSPLVPPGAARHRATLECIDGALSSSRHNCRSHEFYRLTVDRGDNQSHMSGFSPYNLQMVLPPAGTLRLTRLAVPAGAPRGWSCQCEGSQSSKISSTIRQVAAITASLRVVFVDSVIVLRGVGLWCANQIRLWCVRQFKYGAVRCPVVQWIAPEFMPRWRASCGRVRRRRIGPRLLASRNAWQNTGSPAVRYRPMRGWRSRIGYRVVSFQAAAGECSARSPILSSAARFPRSVSVRMDRAIGNAGFSRRRSLTSEGHSSIGQCRARLLPERRPAVRSLGRVLIAVQGRFPARHSVSP